MSEAVGTLAQPSAARRATILRAIVHRMDAWGVAMIVATLAVVVHDAAGPRALVLVIAIGAMYAYAYALNDYFDAPRDAQDPQKILTNPFASELVSRRKAAIGMWLTQILLLIVFAAFSPMAVAALALFLFVAWAYSAPPLRLKSRPGIDVLTHGIFVQTYPYILAAMILADHWMPIDWLLVLLNFLASTSGQLDQQIRDFAVDKLNDSNFTTTVGLRKATALMVIATTGALLATVAIFVLGIAPLTLLPFALIPAPVFVLRLVSPSKSRLDTRLAPALVAIALGYTCILLLA